MNVHKYRERKTKGKFTVKKEGKVIFAVIQTFDRHTGEELEPVIEHVNLKQIYAAKERTVETLADINALIEDIEALEAE